MYKPTIKRLLNFSATVLVVGQNLIGTETLQGITDRTQRFRKLYYFIQSGSRTWCLNMFPLRRVCSLQPKILRDTREEITHCFNIFAIHIYQIGPDTTLTVSEEQDK